MTRSVLLLIACLLVFDLLGQTVFFNNIAQDDGLRNGNVRAIVKDHQGFVWIGTEDGLHRYDGYSMKVYRSTTQDSLTLSSNFILCLFEDSAHNLWVGTLDGGLCFYDRKLDVFRNYHAGQSRSTSVRSIAEGKDKFLYVGSDKLIRAKIADAASMHFDRVKLPSDSVSSPGIRIPSIVESMDSNLLLSVNTQGIFTYDISKGSYHLHPISELEKNIQTVYVDKRRNLIWVGSWKNGVLIYDPVNKKSIRLSAGNDSKSIRNNFVTSIKGDATGNIWIATDNGVSVVAHNVDPFQQLVVTTYQPNKNDQTGINGNIIKTIYVDDQDKVWIGMYYEGLSVYDKNSMNFSSLSIPMEESSSSIYGNINAMQTDARGNLWLGLDGGGLYYVHGSLTKADNSSMKRITTCNRADKIKAMKMDDDQNLWIGTWGNGLSVINTLTHECKEIDISNSTVDMGNDVLSLNVDHAGNLWIGTFDHGLFRYSPNTKQIVKVQSSLPNSSKIYRINAIHIDATDNVWIGNEVGGLNLLSKGDNKYKTIITDHLDFSTTISTIYQDQEGIIWIGVPNLGLVEYNPKTNRSRLFGEDLGLTNSSIYAIQEDSLHNLWVSNNAGLSTFDRLSHRFTNFSKANGLPTSQYNRSSVVKTQDGLLAFGNIRGLSFFNPGDFKNNYSIKKIVFTRFFLNDTEQIVGKPKSVLHENITTVRTIQLKHDQNSFTAEFVSLDYDFSHHLTYQYKLENFDENWKDAGNQRQVTYTNMLPGRYLLKVKVWDRYSDQSLGTHELELIIIPVWWQTLWFKVALAITLLLTALAIHLIRIRYLLAQRKRLKLLVENRTSSLNEANVLLKARIEEIDSINQLLNAQQDEILEKSNEIQTQNEELISQNEHIVEQRESLILAQNQLQEINTLLEKTVDERTEKLKLTIGNLNKTVFELDRFVYSASHDLSAPLKSIRGLVEIIRIEKDPTQVYEYVEYIKGTVLKLEAVIKSMVDYARNAHVLINPEKFNLHNLVKEVLGELAFMPEDFNIIFINNVNKEINIKSDRPRIKVVLHNLVSNAIKYVDRDKTSSWIKLECERHDKYWRLQISDNGIGIHSEHLDKIFNMYFRATELSKGSGLGLFIVKETINKIGGSITVNSEFGVYTTFELHIPDIDTKVE